MEARNTIRAGLLGALLLTGCNLKIDPSILPVVPTPRPSTTDPKSPPPTPTGGDCTRSAPAVPPAAGTARHGAFNAQLLPGGWQALETEQDVIDAIGAEDGGSNWACFQKFYPGAVTVYQGKGGKGASRSPRPIVPGSPTPKPSPTPMIGIATAPPDWFFPPPPPPCAARDQMGFALSGSVYDEQGTPFADGVEVRVSTRGFAFNTTVKVQDGRYYVYDAPAGEKLEITVVHEASGEARRRFVTPAAVYDQCGPQGFAVVNFGGPKTADDALGHRYPLPTVESTFKRADTAVVSGQVYDIAGNPLDGVHVTFTSLSADAPYEAQAISSQGSYVVNNVPSGVPMEIRVEHPQFHARARADVFFAGEGGRKGNVVNFGGDPTLQDPHAPQYALAPLPPENLIRNVPVKGLVESIDGDVVTVGVVRARSYEPKVPFEAKAEIQRDGSYAFPAVPAGVEIEFTLEAPGYEAIFRYERLWLDRGVVINFGGGQEQDDPEGESYALVETIEDDE